MARILTIIFALFFAATLAHAQEPAPAYVGVHTISVHRDKGYKTATPGIYFRTQEGWTAGVLRNSEGRAGAYAGRTFEYGRLALTAGVITGYSGGTSAMLVPSIRVARVGGYDARLLFVPKAPGTRGSPALSLTVELAVF